MVTPAQAARLTSQMSVSPQDAQAVLLARFGNRRAADNLAALLASSNQPLPRGGAALGRAIGAASMTGAGQQQARLIAHLVTDLAAGERAGGSSYAAHLTGLSNPSAAALGAHASQVDLALSGNSDLAGFSASQLRAAAQVLTAGPHGPAAVRTGFGSGLLATLDDDAATWHEQHSPQAFLSDVHEGAQALSHLEALGPAQSSALQDPLAITAATAMISHGLNAAPYALPFPPGPGNPFLQSNGKLVSAATLARNPSAMSSLIAWLGQESGPGRPAPLPGSSTNVLEAIQAGLDAGEGLAG